MASKLILVREFPRWLRVEKPIDLSRHAMPPRNTSQDVLFLAMKIHSLEMFYPTSRIKLG
jgi:hypothetical protein